MKQMEKGAEFPSFKQSVAATEEFSTSELHFRFDMHNETNEHVS